MTQQLAIVRENTDVLVFSDEKKRIIRDTYARDASDAEFVVFLERCQRAGLEPGVQMHFTKRVGKMTIVTAIDGFRLIAERTGKYAGNDDPVFSGDIAVGSKHGPAKATVTVWKVMPDGVRYPFTASARWDEYKPDQNDFMWKKMPYTMLGKCAEALALRKAFPQDLSGLYTADEMGQADNNVVSVPVEAASVLEAALADGVTPVMLDDYRALYKRGSALGLDMKPYLVDKSVARNRLAQLGKSLAAEINAFPTPAEEPPAASDTINAADLAMIRAQRGGN